MVAEGAEAVEAGDYTALESLDIADVGLLLPGFEVDIDLSAAVLEEEEVHDEVEEEEVVAGLGDLLEEEEIPAVTDDAEISLDDLAEQEEEGAEEEESPDKI
jgi:hypothetical protein